MADQNAERTAFIAIIGIVAFGFQQQALKLQRTETDRRLRDLNNEGARLQVLATTNVSNDTWVGFHTSYEITQERYAARFASIERFQNKILGAIAIVAIIIPALTILLSKHL